MTRPAPSFFAELKRRNVYKVGAMYAVAGWLLVQVVTQVFPIFDISALVQRIIVLAIVAGFPIALVLSWIYELTPQGIVRTDEVEDLQSITPQTGQRLNRAIIAVLLLAVIVLAAGLLWPRLGERATEHSDKSIAVLPFANLSDDSANAYFADGIQDEILTRLAKIGELKVISRTSTLQYAVKPAGLREIGEQLGVANIVEGSVQKSGNIVRINVQLIRAATDEHLWAERYDRKLDDVFGVQGEVAAAIAEALKAHLTPAEQRQLTERPTQNVEAYDAYLRALALSRQGGDLRKETLGAIEALEQAVKLDPDFAQAWAQLSHQHAFAYWNFAKNAQHRQQAREARDRASQLAPAAPDTLKVQGLYVYWIERDYAAALQIFEQLQQQMPNDEIVTMALAAITRRQGRYDDSLAYWKRAIDLDPRNVLTVMDAVQTARAMRDFATADRWLAQAMSLLGEQSPALLGERASNLLARGEVEQALRLFDGVDSSHEPLLSSYLSCLLLDRRYAEAIRLMRSALLQPEADGDERAYAQGLLGYTLRLSGDAAAARPVLEQARADLQALSIRQPDDLFVMLALANAEADLGNREAALELARRLQDQLPVMADDYIGPTLEERIVRIRIQLDEREGAIESIRRLLSISYAGALTIPLLKLDPDFDALRDDPRFQAMLSADEGGAKP